MNQVEQAAVIIHPHQTYEYNLYLSGPINNSEQYLEFYSALKSATPEDSVRIHINSEGGCLSTALEIVMHMMECQAPIQAVVGVSCSSAATLIALNCDSIMVNDYSSMLVHNMSYGSYSESASQLDLASFNSKLNEKLIRNTYTNFLTEKNLDKVLNGRDVLLDSEEIVEGWNRKQEEERIEQGDFDFSDLQQPLPEVKSDL